MPTMRIPCLLMMLIALLTADTFHPLAAAEPDPFARWEKSIAAFEQQDLKQPPPKNSVLFVGSSSIRLWNLKKSFPGKDYINRGFGGSEIADSTHFARRIILKHRPRTIVLYAGDNDISHGKSVERVASDFREFVQTVRRELPRTRILFIAIKPSTRRWNLAPTMHAANEEIRKICEEGERLEFVDIWKPMLGEDGKPRPELLARDGLHLSPKGYQLWTATIEPLLEPTKKP